MIKFTLKCQNDHTFDSWFGSNDDYDRLQEHGLIGCAVCGNSEIEKAIMTPQVTCGSKGAESPLSQTGSAAEQAVRELRVKIESCAEDVGKNFAREARKIFDGRVRKRAIFGQAKPEEARALIEDGVPVVPLPWSNRNTN